MLNLIFFVTVQIKHVFISYLGEKMSFKRSDTGHRTFARFVCVVSFKTPTLRSRLIPYLLIHLLHAPCRVWAHLVSHCP